MMMELCGRVQSGIPLVFKLTVAARSTQNRSVTFGKEKFPRGLPEQP